VLDWIKFDAELCSVWCLSGLLAVICQGCDGVEMCLTTLRRLTVLVQLRVGVQG
jgi:hypothetical protein